jgi:hypothetical protein
MLLDITHPQSIAAWFFQLLRTARTWIMQEKNRKNENYFLIN